MEGQSKEEYIGSLRRYTFKNVISPYFVSHCYYQITQGGIIYGLCFVTCFAEKVVVFLAEFLNIEV